MNCTKRARTTPLVLPGASVARLCCPLVSCTVALTLTGAFRGDLRMTDDVSDAVNEYGYASIDKSHILHVSVVCVHSATLQDVCDAHRSWHKAADVIDVVSSKELHSTV